MKNILIKFLNIIDKAEALKTPGLNLLHRSNHDFQFLYIFPENILMEYS